MRRVAIRGARIRGSIDAAMSSWGGPLTLQSCYIDNPVNLKYAESPGIELVRCVLNAGERGTALDADGVTVKNSVMLGGSVFKGMISLTDANISGNLQMAGTRIKPSSAGFAADSGRLLGFRMTIGGSFIPRFGFEADRLFLAGSHFASGIQMIEATVGMGDEDATFDLRDVTVEGGVVIKRSRINAPLNAENSTIAGTLTLSGEFGAPGHASLSMQAANIDVLHVEEGTRFLGEVDLSYSRVRVLDDDLAAWPSTIDLAGFSYEALADDPRTGHKGRLEWIRKQKHGPLPQPYEQLAAIYRSSGHASEAQRILIAMNDDSRSRLPRMARAWSWVTRLLVGYGYQPWLAGVWLAGLLFISTAIFQMEHPEHVKIIKPDEGHPKFNPFIYALDKTLPVLNLGHQQFFFSTGFAGYWEWITTAAGWIFGAALAASLAGFVKRGGS